MFHYLSVIVTGFFLIVLLLSPKHSNALLQQNIHHNGRYQLRAKDNAVHDEKDDTVKGKEHAVIEYGRLVGRLKTTPRTGWLRRGVPDCESVADHSWRMAALCFLLPKEQYDISRCIALAVVHDMAEAIVGDIAPDDNVSKKEKQKREMNAIYQIASVLQRIEVSDAKDDLLQLFHEYEERASKESVAVKELDQLDMILQADEYELQYGLDLDEFFQSTPVGNFRIPEIQKAVKELHWQHQNRQQYRNAQDSSAPSSSGLLSDSDSDFVMEFCADSDLDNNSIESVVRALRVWEEKKR